MKGCELCNRAAKMYCESDQASLCWECDAKVHGANFLVARHPRVLLCRSCQSQTAWKASGARLSPTFSVCESCAAGGKESGEECEGEAAGGGEMMEEEEEDDYDDEISDSDVEEEEEEEEEGENQVVPWTETAPPPASSSSGEESSWTGKAGVDILHQTRRNADLEFQRDLACSDSRRNHLMSVAAPLGRSADKEYHRSILRQGNSSSATAGEGNYSSTRVLQSNFDLASSASRSNPI